MVLNASISSFSSSAYTQCGVLSILTLLRDNGASNLSNLGLQSKAEFVADALGATYSTAIGLDDWEGETVDTVTEHQQQAK